MRQCQPQYKPETRGSARVRAFLLTLLAAGAAVLVLQFALRQSPERPGADEPVQSAYATADERGPSDRSHGSTAAPDPIAQARAVLAGMSTNSPAAPHARTLLDGSQAARVRARAARSLAQLGTAEAVAALKVAYVDGKADLREAVAEALGACANTEAMDAARQLLETGEERVALGVIRGLGDRGDAGAAQLLGEVLFSADRPETARVEAAFSLGEMGQDGRSEALQTLLRAASELRDETVLHPVLDQLGQHSFEETGAFFKDYLRRSDVPVEDKVAALEALRATEGNVTGLLLEYAAHPDPRVRAAAASALTNAGTGENLAGTLVNLARSENDPQVRARLYQALANREVSDSAPLLALVRGEADSVARVSALKLAAAAARTGADPEVVRFFNQDAVPELSRIALTSPLAGDRMSAVVALSQAGTPEAQTALARLAAETKDPKLRDAISRLRPDRAGQ